VTKEERLYVLSAPSGSDVVDFKSDRLLGHNATVYVGHFGLSDSSKRQHTMVKCVLLAYFYPYSLLQCLQPFHPHPQTASRPQENDLSM